MKNMIDEELTWWNLMGVWIAVVLGVVMFLAGVALIAAGLTLLI